MKKIFAGITVFIFLCMCGGCESTSEDLDRDVVNRQQTHYGKGQPIPFYDFSIPRDVLIQIYNVVTQGARNTYSVIETITGETKFHGPSIGYGIPTDMQLTNPLQPAHQTRYDSGIIEQAEPNGLFSSKNTDGTWVLFVDDNGDITPVYTEHKVTTYPFAVKKTAEGLWVRADTKKATVTVKLNKQPGQ